MTWLAWVALGSTVAAAGSLLLWRRERKLRRQAEAAAATHQVRLEAEVARGTALEIARAAADRQLKEIHADYHRDKGRLLRVKEEIDKAVAGDGGDLADVWNRLMDE